MPYSGPNDSSLPDNVKKLSEEKRKQWVEVFNSAIKDGDEGKAFREANGVVKKTKAYIESWDIYGRQVDPENCGYDSLGANDSKGCANCNWFVSPDGCIIVNGITSPTGICSHWLEKPVYEAQPVPVVIVDQPKEMTSLIEKFKEFLSSIFASRAKETDDIPAEQPIKDSVPPVQCNKFTFYKQKDGRIRFFTVYSNNFKDREGETFLEEAHKEFVEWTDKEQKYPSLWLWHSGPNSKWGQIDWLDYTDGFVCASGLVDKDKEYIAENLQNQDVSVSHGFVALMLPGDKSIYRYRTFEISPLPSEFAANSWTDFTTNSGELKMPFSDKKKTWLKQVGGLDDTQITNWEKDVDALSSNLKELGIEFKDTEQVDLAGQMQTMTAALVALTTRVKEIADQQKAYAANLDAEFAKMFTAEVAKLPNGFKASEDDSTKVPEEKQKDLKQETDWFGSVIKI